MRNEGRSKLNDTEIWSLTFFFSFWIRVGNETVLKISFVRVAKGSKEEVGCFFPFSSEKVSKAL